MKDLIIKETLETPSVYFNFSKGHFLIEGRSIPENSSDFYQPIISWLEEYKSNSKGLTTVDFKLEYFNTSTSKYILDILRSLMDISKDKASMIINWYYDEFDEEILEIGHDFSSIIHFPFNIIVIPSVS